MMNNDENRIIDDQYELQVADDTLKTILRTKSKLDQ